MIRNVGFALLLILATGIGATEKIKTVDIISAKTLGDFWGVEFPIEGAEVEPTMGSTLYLDPIGDLVVQFSYSGGTDLKNNRSIWYFLLYHVAQKTILHREKEITRLAQKSPETKQDRYIREHNFVKVKTAPFKVNDDDTEYSFLYYLTPKYRWSSTIGGDICRPSIEGTLRVKDLQRKSVVEKTLLYSSQKKVGHHSAPGCVMEGNGSGRPRKLSTIAVGISDIWLVDDGTVLVEVSEIPYLIRLTPELTSYFVDKRHELQFFKPGILLPIYEQAFEQHWEKAYQKPDQDVYEIVDNILFRFVQQYKNSSTALTAQNP